MSFSTGTNYCDKCGKPLGIYKQGLCAKCEKAEQEPNTGHWIPVSERLPEEGTFVLCSVTDEKHSVVINQYNAREYWFDCKIIAWMPLPKPYEPQESEVRNV